MSNKFLLVALVAILAIQSTNAGFLELDEFAIGFFGYHSVNPQSFLQCWNASTADVAIAAWKLFDAAAYALYKGDAQNYSQNAYELEKLIAEIGSDIDCAQNSTSMAHILEHYKVQANWSNVENDFILYFYEYITQFYEYVEKGVGNYLYKDKYTQAGAYLAANLEGPLKNISVIFNSSSLQLAFFNGLFLAANQYPPWFGLTEDWSSAVLNFISGLANAVNNASAPNSNVTAGQATAQYLQNIGLPLWQTIPQGEREYLLKDNEDTHRISKALNMDFSSGSFNQSFYDVAFDNSDYVGLMQEAAYYVNGQDFFTAGILFENVLELVSKVYNNKTMTA